MRYNLITLDLFLCASKNKSLVKAAKEKNIVFGVFLRLKPDNDYRVANKVANSRQVYFLFLFQLN